MKIKAIILSPFVILNIALSQESSNPKQNPKDLPPSTSLKGAGAR